MLHKILIKNYALIDNLEIEFDAGMNIITGETGAGKSIILGALSLILGQRAESKYFFNRDKKCVIEGVFNVNEHNYKVLFEQYDLDFYEENTLRREISIDGKSRSFINDTPVNLATLKNISEHLIAIHSQHASLEIANNDFQFLILDSLANHPNELYKYQADYKLLIKSEKDLIDLQQKASEAKNKQDYEQFLFDELEQAQLQQDEQMKLEIELEKLNHSESIKRALQSATQLLADTDINVLNSIKQVLNELNTVVQYDSEITALNERLLSVHIELKDINNELAYLENNTQHDNQRLEEIQNRLDLIYSLQKKHRVTVLNELLAIKESLAESLEITSSYDNEIDKLTLKVQKLRNELFELAQTIHVNRQKAVVNAQEQICLSLAQMGMQSAKLDFRLSNTEGLGLNGISQLTLYFTANSGQDFAPIQKVASGGELSRLMLAIKTLLAKHTQLATLIFDEIDTGISGETALKVGKVIDGLSKDMQVIAITHLPQIAAIGKSHFYVYKDEKDLKTNTHLKKLVKEERVQVIAEMLSGKNPGTSAIANAKDLLYSE